MTKRQSHSIKIELNGTEPAEVLVGSEFVLTGRVACTDGCALSGASIKLAGPDDAAAGECAIGPDGTLNAALQAPPRAGEQVWRLVFAGHEVDGVRHDETAIAARISVKPYATSLAVWDIPSPVVTGEKCAIKVGAKSSAGIALDGQRIEIRDAAGTVLGHGSLAAAPLPGTSALHWTELELSAAAAPGMHAWSARFAAADLALEHDGATYKFDVVVVPPPEHRLTVRVIERDSATPIADAQLRLGAYWAATDARGRAEIAMPKGSYRLTVWKVGYEAPPTRVEVTADLTVEVAMLPVPEENPDAAWMM
jgi:hypothetical protein